MEERPKLSLKIRTVNKAGFFYIEASSVFAYLIFFFSGIKLSKDTLDSGINVALGINVVPGTFGKNIKRSP